MKSLGTKPTGQILAEEIRTYRTVESNEYDNFEWEMVLVMKDETNTVGQRFYHNGGSGNDIKGSRAVICREHKVTRNLTISEYYGNSIVD